MISRVLSVCLIFSALLPILCARPLPASDEDLVINAALIERLIAEVAWYYPEALDTFRERRVVDLVLIERNGALPDLYGAIARTDDDKHAPVVWIYWGEFGIFSKSYFVFSGKRAFDYYFEKNGIYGTYAVQVKAARKPKLPEPIRTTAEEHMESIKAFLADRLCGGVDRYGGLDSGLLGGMEYGSMSEEDVAYVRGVIDNPEAHTQAISGPARYYIGDFYISYVDEESWLMIAVENGASKEVFSLVAYAVDNEPRFMLKHWGIGDSYIDYYVLERRGTDGRRNSYKKLSEEQAFVARYNENLAYFETLKRTSYYSGTVYVRDALSPVTDD